MEREQQPVSKRAQIMALAGWLAFLSQALATSVEVFLHRRFGERYFGSQAAAVLLLVPCYCLFWEGHDLSAMMLFLGLYLVACLAARIGIARRRRSGDLEHSFYSGSPDILRCKLLGRASEKTVKAVIEPLLVLAAGAAVSQFDRPLGGYLMLAAAGLFVSIRLAIGYQRARLVDMRDAFLEQKSLMERFHRGE